MRETDIIERSFLQELRSAAQGMASGNLNPLWKQAYLDLAIAADRLDAMNARCEVPDPSWQSGIPTNSDPILTDGTPVLNER